MACGELEASRRHSGGARERRLVVYVLDAFPGNVVLRQGGFAPGRVALGWRGTSEL